MAAPAVAYHRRSTDKQEQSLADQRSVNRRGVIGPRGDFSSSTTIKAILANPAYLGDLVWDRRTEAKFYAVRQGRADQMRPAQESARVSVTRRKMKVGRWPSWSGWCSAPRPARKPPSTGSWR